MDLTRRGLFALLRGTSPTPAPLPPAVIGEATRAQAKSFREALAARRRGSDDGPRFAVLTHHLCLLRLGTECSTCAEVCPEPGALTLRGRSVELDATRCTGCGRCVERCPAPIPALALRPVAP